MSDLMLLSTKSFKQKFFNKKLSYKFVNLFRIKNKINEQTYRLMLFNIYRIYNIFYVLFLKSYLHRANDQEAKVIMQILILINNIKHEK